MKRIKQFTENALGFFRAVRALFKRAVKEEVSPTGNPSDEEKLKMEAKRKRAKSGVRIMLFIATCVYTAILILWMYCRIQLGEKDVRHIGDTTITLSGIFLALALFIATVDGLLIPKRDEFVAFYFLEKYLFTKGPGGLVWRFRLFNILTAYRIKIILYSVEVEFTARTGGPGSIVYRTGESAATYAGNHLHEQLHVRVKVVVEFDIDDAEQFGMKVRTLENAIDLFRENIIEAGRQEIGKNTLATMDGKLEETADPMKLKLEQYVEKGVTGEKAGRLGVNIRTFKIIELEPDESVNKGLNAIVASHMGVKIAANEAEAAKKKADGEKYRLTEEGAGKANAAKSLGMVEAEVEKAKQEATYGPQLEYQKSMARIAKTEHGLNSMKLYTMEKTYANNTKIVTTQEHAGFTNLLTLTTTVTKP